MVMDCASAELCKYAANAMLATRISFMNEVPNVCELVGADVDQVRRAVASDRRIGPAFLFPGVGYGGSCFPEGRQGDAEVRRRQELRLPDPGGGRERQRAAEEAAVREDEAALRVAEGQADRVWGLAFKPRTDDMREAPAMPIIEGAARRRARRSRPTIPRRPRSRGASSGPRSTSRDKSYDALKGADALALVTEWNEFREPDFARMKKRMKTPVIFDGRNIYNPEQIAGRASPTTRWAVPWPCSSPAAPATSAATPSRRCSAAGAEVVIFDDLSAGHRARGESGRRAARGRATSRDIRARAPRSSRRTASTRSCTLPPGCRSASRSRDPAGYYDNNVGGALSRARGDGRAGVSRFIFSSTCATFGEPGEMPIDETHPQQPINAYGETKLAVERALPHFETRLRAAQRRPALLQRRRRRSGRRARRGPRPRDPHHSAGDRRRVGRGRLRCSARITRRRTAPACATTSTSPTWPTAHVRALESLRAGGPSAPYNVGTGTPSFGARTS